MPELIWHILQRGHAAWASCASARASVFHRHLGSSTRRMLCSSQSASLRRRIPVSPPCSYKVPGIEVATGDMKAMDHGLIEVIGYPGDSITEVYNNVV